MSVRDLSTETAAPETVPEPIAAGPAEAEATTKFSAEGALPEVQAAEAAAPPATASELAFENERSPGNHLTVLGTEHGMVTWEAYKHDCEVAGKADEWKDHYVNGHTEAAGWKQPADHWTENHFVLDKNQSASRALKAFLAGPTITDWHAAKVALDLEDLLSELGDQRFDLLFGSEREAEDCTIPKEQRLRISAADVVTTYVDHLREIASGYEAKETEPTHPEEFVAPPPTDGPKPAKPGPEEAVDEMVARGELERDLENQPEVV